MSLKLYPLLLLMDRFLLGLLRLLVVILAAIFVVEIVFASGFGE